MKGIPGKRYDLSRGFSEAEGEMSERFMTVSTERERLQKEVLEINKKLKKGGLTRSERARLCNHYQGKCTRLKKLKKVIEKRADINQLAVQCLKCVVDEDAFYEAINKAKAMQRDILNNISGWD